MLIKYITDIPHGLYNAAYQNQNYCQFIFGTRNH